MMTWLHSFKISLLICQLVNISDHSSTPSFLTRSPKEKVVVLKVSQLRTSLIWLRTILQVTSRSSWRRSGSFSSTDGSCRTALVVPKPRWTSYWNLRVTGKHFKSSITLSWDKNWHQLQATAWERSISITWDISTQVEPLNSTTPRSSKNYRIDSRLLSTGITSKRSRTQSKMTAQKLSKARQSMMSRRRIFQEDTQWLCWVSSTMDASMPSSD